MTNNYVVILLQQIVASVARFVIITSLNLLLDSSNNIPLRASYIGYSKGISNVIKNLYKSNA